MIRTETISLKKKGYDLGLGIERMDLIILVMGFFLARANVLDRLTPFGFAFLSAYIIMKNANLAILLSVSLGSMSVQGIRGISYVLPCFVVYGFFHFTKEERFDSLIKASLISTFIFISLRGIGVLTAKSFFIYDLFLLLFEGILVFTMTYIFSFSLPIEKLKGTNFNNEKTICTFITLALMLSGVHDIMIFSVSIKNIFSTLMLLSLSYSQGAFTGGTIGIILGMVGYMSTPEMPFIIAIFGVTGLLSGIFRDLGKTGSSLGFILGNVIISFYINGLGSSFIVYKEIIIGVLLFLISSEKINKEISKTFTANISPKKNYTEKKDDIIIKKLNRLSALFDKLGSTFRESAEERDFNLTTEVYSLVDGVVNASCMECPKYERCWEENYYNSYNSFFNLVSLIEVRNIDEEIYMEARKFCIKPDEILDKIDRSMEMLKLDNAWKTKLKDNRILLSEQLEGVGKVISSISKDIYINPTFNEEAEESIYKDLKNNRIDVKEVSVAGIGEEDFEVFVDLNSHNISEHKIKSIISESLGFPLVSDSNLGSSKTGEKRFKLLRNNRFSAMTKIATMPNSENKISGDSFTFGEIENTHFSALSDGMGIGRRANEESKVAISLLERLMEANVDKDLTLKTINSVLRAKSNEEMFTTLDLSFVDLYSGKLQMIKTGSPATFIKKKDRIEVINSSSLPVGILKDVDFNIYEEFVEDGDIIIMMSDGILDASRDIENTEEWMKKVIIDIDSVNPQIIAKEILEQAKNVITDVRDDMTVIVTKVWKNI
jgi:stage II sporulation protein E